MQVQTVVSAALLLLSVASALEAPSETCSAPPQPGRTITDISVLLNEKTVNFMSATGLGADMRTLEASIEEGEDYNGSFLKMSAHTGTHLDSPGHFVQSYYATGRGVADLDLALLNGPALVMELPDDVNVTAAALEALEIPRGITRLILKTLNTKLGLMTQTAFEPSYTAFTKDGAEFLVANTDVQLIGIDYLSVAHFADLKGPHVVMLEAGLLPVEGLVLDGVAPGLYDLHCLPLRLAGSDGSPCRCILIS